MHLRQKSRSLPPQLRRKVYLGAAPRLTVIQRATRNLAAEHFFKAHRLSSELERVFRALFRLSALILHGIGLPQALAAFERNARLAAAEFQHVARA